jgi:hypothetical protein
VVTVTIEDLEKVLQAMNNPYIITKYKINTNLLNKCAIINDFNFILKDYNDNFNMNTNEIDEYIDMLIKLHDFLIDKYDIFIIQNKDEIICINEIKKLESINDDISESIDISDKIEKSLLCSSIKDLLNISNPINDNINNEKLDNVEYKMDNLIELIEYLKLNIHDFQLNSVGEKYLLDQLLIIDLQNNVNIQKTIEDINNLCLYVKTKYSE